MSVSAQANDAAARRKRWARRFNLGTAGFTMSLGLTLAALYSDARGSDVATRPLEQMLVYRDGEGDQSVLNLATKLVLVNAADAAHGDVLMKAELELGGLTFAMGGTVQPTFTADPDVAEKCPLGSRCIVRQGLVAVEQPDEVLDIPGGSHLLTTLTFPLVSWNCTGPEQRCAALTTAAAQRALLGRQARPKLTIHFYADGKREMRCGLKTVDLGYLEKIGWSAIPCSDASVSGGPLI